MGNDVEGGIKKDNSFLIKYFSEKQRKQFIGKKNDDTVVIQLKKAFDDKNLSNVTSVDVDMFIEANYSAIKLNNPATYYGNYHGTYEPPFCHAQARALFDMVK